MEPQQSQSYLGSATGWFESYVIKILNLWLHRTTALQCTSRTREVELMHASKVSSQHSDSLPMWQESTLPDDTYIRCATGQWLDHR